MKILKFSASWCNPCKQLTTSIKASGCTVPVEEIDIDNNPDLAAKFQIRSIPTLVAVSDDDVALARNVGALSSKTYRDWVQSLE